MSQKLLESESFRRGATSPATAATADPQLGSGDDSRSQHYQPQSLQAYLFRCNLSISHAPSNSTPKTKLSWESAGLQN